MSTTNGNTNGTTATTSSSSTQSPILARTHSLLAAYRQLSPTALASNLSPSFTHHVLPSAMGMPSRNLTAFQKHSQMITSIFSTFAMIPSSIIVDEEQKAVVVNAKMEGVLKTGEEGGKGMDYENECVLMLWFEEVEGEWLIREMKEYVDSAKAAEMKRGMEAKMGKEGVRKMMHE